jgi:hypothetical protein
MTVSANDSFLMAQFLETSSDGHQPANYSGIWWLGDTGRSDMDDRLCAISLNLIEVKKELALA